MTSATEGRTANLFKVAHTVNGNIVIGYYRGTEFSPDEALNLAMWLQQLAFESGGNYSRFIRESKRLAKQRRNTDGNTTT
jgi:hypothetical protein